MSRKIIVLNIVLLLLIIIMVRAGHYFLNYHHPTDFSNGTVLNEEWQLLFLLIFIYFLLSGVLSLIPIRLFTFKNRWGGLFGVFNFILLISLFDYFESKKRFEDLEKEVVAKAQRDIKNDEVVWFFEHGFVILVDDYEKLRKQKDSIYAKYGIKVEDMGCIATPYQDVLEQKYKVIVKDYLDKRNGEDWEERLEKELESIK